MATLKSIRKRILSVKSTQKITKAMKMVAAAKLRRAQQALMGARPHAQILEASLVRLVQAAEAWDHPLLKVPENPQKGNLLVITSDRGLCGGFNGNLLRRVDEFLRHEGKEIPEWKLSTLGRKGRDYYRAKRVPLESAESLSVEGFDFTQAHRMAKAWMERFQAGEFDCFYLAYNSFKSAISQVPTLRCVLPLELSTPVEEVAAPVAWQGDPQAIIHSLLHRYLTTLFFVAVLESQASELGARMSAMDNATNNASEMIGSLTLQYNRARQAAITTELMDIVNGAEALG